MFYKKKHILMITLIFCMVFGALILSFIIPGILKINSNNNIEDNDENLIISVNYNTIFIDGNNMFATVASNEGWSGDGTYSNPYIIENYEIDASISHGIEIRNTNVYFIIRNVSVSNGRSNYNYGFYFTNVTNGELINNTADNNIAGYLLRNSNYNIFTSNLATKCLHGFRIWYSNNNTLKNNTANDNIEYGIFLDNSNNNTISGNVIYLNGLGTIYEKNCMWNDISNNIYGPQPFTLFSDVDGFDADGSFTLTWTASEFADNYTLYQDGEIIAEGVTTTNYSIFNLAIGTYEFRMKAISKYEQLYSNKIEVIVSKIIHIEGNADFYQTAVAKGFTGSGTYSHPYIIENYEIIAWRGHGIHIQNTDVYFIIRNVRVSNVGKESNNGFYLVNVTNGKLENNTANNNLYGFLLKDAYNNTLEGNIAKDNINGITLNSSNYNTLIYNNVTNNRHGLSLYSSYNNTLMSNEVTGNTHLGIYLDSSNNNIIINNTATDNLNGFSLSYSNNNTITNNTANNNNQHGFHLWYSNNNFLTENIIKTNFKYGIYLEESNFNVIMGNSLQNNGIGPIYEKKSEDKNYPDIFLISAIITVIGVVSFIIFKLIILIRKKFELPSLKLILKKLFKDK